MSCMELLERAGEAGEDTPFCDTLMASGAGDLVTRVTCVTCVTCVMQGRGQSALTI